MSVSKRAVAEAKRRVTKFLTDEVGVTNFLGFDRHAVEEIYYLRVEAPDGDTLRVIDLVDPLVSEIANENDFMIAVVPYPTLSREPAASTST